MIEENNFSQKKSIEFCTLDSPEMTHRITFDSLGSSEVMLCTNESQPSVIDNSSVTEPAVSDDAGVSSQQSVVTDTAPAQNPLLVGFQDLTVNISAVPRLWVSSVTPEIVDYAFYYNYLPLDYGGKAKNDLIMHIGELLLMSLVVDKQELYRFLPYETRLEEDGTIVLPETVCLKQEYCQKCTTTPFPLLMSATVYDRFAENTGLTLEQRMLQKAFWIMQEFGLDTDNPFVVDVDALIQPNSPLSFGLFQQLPYEGLYHYAPIGEMYSQQEQYVTDAPAHYGYNPFEIRPLRNLVHHGSPIKPCFLPHRVYHLWGMERLLYTTDTTIVLTPDLREYFNNAWYLGMPVLSWYGAEWTISKVDFGPLTGKTVYYVFNPGSFWGDYVACNDCMNMVLERLHSLGCTVHIIGNPGYQTQLELL